MQVLNRSLLTPTVRLPRSVCRRQRHATVAHAAAPSNTRVRYIKRPQETKLFMYAVPPPKEVDSVANISVDEVPMQLSDLRTANHMTLQQNGFELVQIPSGQGINWEDKEQVWPRLWACPWVCTCFLASVNAMGRCYTGEGDVLPRSQVSTSAHDIC